MARTLNSNDYRLTFPPASVYRKKPRIAWDRIGVWTGIMVGAVAADYCLGRLITWALRGLFHLVARL